jgi:hypothetical protein
MVSPFICFARPLRISVRSTPAIHLWSAIGGLTRQRRARFLTLRHDDRLLTASPRSIWAAVADLVLRQPEDAARLSNDLASTKRRPTSGTPGAAA